MSFDGQSESETVGNAPEIPGFAKRLTGKFTFRLPQDCIVHTISVEVNGILVGILKTPIVIAQGATFTSHKTHMTLPNGSEQECLVTIKSTAP